MRGRYPCEHQSDNCQANHKPPVALGHNLTHAIPICLFGEAAHAPLLSGRERKSQRGYASSSEQGTDLAAHEARGRFPAAVQPDT